MANYNFFLSDGVTEITVLDSVVNNTYSVPLLGQNTTAYGDDVAAGIMRNLENFAAPSDPATNVNVPGTAVLKGQLWFDTTTNVMRVNVGTTATPDWQQISTIDQGATADAMLRWSGTNWVEESQIRATSGGVLRIFDIGLTDEMNMSHNGTDFTFAFVNTNAVVFDNVGSHVQVADDAEFRVSGGVGNSQAIEFVPGDAVSDGFIRTVGVNRFRIGGALGRFDIDGALGLEERASAPADIATYGQVWVNSADNGLYYTNESGTDTRIDVTAGGTVTATSGADNRIAVFSTATNIEGDASFEWDASSATMTLANTTGTDTAAFRHDGTDFNTTFTNTTDWNISGLTTLQVTGNIDATGNLEGQSLDIVNTNTFQITAFGEVTMDVNGATALNIRGMDENDTGLNLEDGMKLVFEDLAQSNPISINNTGIGGFGGQLEITTATSAGVWLRDGINMRVYDGTNTNHGTIQTLGSDFRVSGFSSGNLKLQSSPGVDRINVAAQIEFESTQTALTSLSGGTQDVGVGLARSTKMFVNGSDGTARDIGYNVMPTQTLPPTGPKVLDIDDVSYYLGMNGILAGSSVTCPQDINIPIGATFVIAHDGAVGTVSISAGAGASLEWLNGSGAIPTGTRTLAIGGVCTIRKASGGGTHRWVIWGTGLT